MSETIGKRLRRLRHELGFSQRELATGRVSYAYISRIEAGQRNPSLKAIRELAAKLGVTPLYLETGQEKTCPHCGNGAPVEMMADLTRAVEGKIRASIAAEMLSSENFDASEVFRLAKTR